MAEEIFDIYVMVKETGAIVHASEEKWCRIREVKPGREWIYGFEEMKGQPSPDFDYDEPILDVEKIDSRLQLTVKEYRGNFHVDVFAFNRLIWSGVGGPERRHVGDSVIVEIPEVIPPAPPPAIPPAIPPAPPPAPPSLEPITNRLDILSAQIRDIKREMVVKANTYSVVNIDLTIARPSFVAFDIAGDAMTIFTCTGRMELKLGDITMDPIPIAPLVYPAMIVIDRMEFKRFFVKNTAQLPPAAATLIVWRRE